MKAVDHIRKQFGFSQEETAQYLGITRSAYAMFEQGRRPLNVHALKKLEALIVYIGERGNQDRAVDEPANEWVVSVVRERIEQCKREATILKRKLQRMEATYQHLIRMSATVQQLLQASGQDRIQLAWLAVQENEIPVKMKACSVDAQFLLKSKIEGLLAEAEALERMVEIKN